MKKTAVLKAIEKSIEHWEQDILTPLVEKKHIPIVSSMYDSSVCPLCKKFVFCGGPDDDACCPLVMIDQHCSADKAAWSVFDRNHTAAAARRMVSVLKKASLYVDKHFSDNMKRKKAKK